MGSLGDLSADVYNIDRFKRVEESPVEQLGALTDLGESLDEFLIRIDPIRRWDTHGNDVPSAWNSAGLLAVVLVLALSVSLSILRLVCWHRKRSKTLKKIKKALERSPEQLCFKNGDKPPERDFFADILSDEDAVSVISYFELKQIELLQRMCLSAALVRKFCEEFQAGSNSHEDSELPDRDAVAEVLRHGSLLNPNGLYRRCLREAELHADEMKADQVSRRALSVLTASQSFPLSSFAMVLPFFNSAKTNNIHQTWTGAFRSVLETFRATWDEQRRRDARLAQAFDSCVAAGDLPGLESVARNMCRLDDRAQKVFKFMVAMNIRPLWLSPQDSKWTERIAECDDMVATLGKLRDATRRCKSIMTHGHQTQSGVQSALNDLEVAHADARCSDWADSDVVIDCEKVLDEFDAAEDSSLQVVGAGGIEARDLISDKPEAECKAEVSMGTIVFQSRAAGVHSPVDRCPAKARTVDILSVAPTGDLLRLSLNAQIRCQRQQRRDQNFQQARDNRAKLVRQKARHRVEEKRWDVFLTLFLKPFFEFLRGLSRKADVENVREGMQLQIALQRRNWQLGISCAALCVAAHFVGYVLSQRSMRTLEELMTVAFHSCNCSENSTSTATSAYFWWLNDGFLTPGVWFGQSIDLLFWNIGTECTALYETLCKVQTVAWVLVTANLGMCIHSIGLQFFGNRFLVLPVALFFAAPALRILVRVMIKIVRPVVLENVATAALLAMVTMQAQKYLQGRVGFPIDSLLIVIAMTAAHIRGCAELSGILPS